MPVQVSREIGRHRSDVHTPGPELVAVAPDTCEDYLYDDTIDVETARREHRHFVAPLERFAHVRSVRDLLTEVADHPEVRELPMRQTTDIARSESLARELEETPARTLVRWLIEGREEPQRALEVMRNETGRELPPFPEASTASATASAPSSRFRGVSWCATAARAA